jgi:hypothetical protein
MPTHDKQTRPATSLIAIATAGRFNSSPKIPTLGIFGEVNEPPRRHALAPERLAGGGEVEVVGVGGEAAVYGQGDAGDEAGGG